MRVEQYRLPGDGAADAEVAVFYFPGTGGSVQANIDRWTGQFTLPDGSPATQAAKVEKQEISGFAVTLVDVAGTFNGGMAPAGGGAGPQPDYRMLGAVIETGDAPWFVKLTGPQQTVAKWKDSFDEFISSIGTR